MRFLFRVVPETDDRRAFLATVREIAQTLGSEARNPKWTSYGALEMDAFSPTRGDFQLLASALEPLCKLEFVRDLNTAPQFKPEEEQFAEALGYFNSERYWESHEVLEGVWRTKQGAEKSLLQGIILVCAAFVHHQKGEESVAVGVLQRARRQLDYGERRYHGFDIEALRKATDSCLASGRLAEFRL